MIKKIFKEAADDLRKARESFKKVFAILAFRRIKRKAMQLHKEFNCQVFVIKMNGEIKVISKHQFKEMRQRGYIKKDFNAGDLKKIALFYTPKHYDKKRT